MKWFCVIVIWEQFGGRLGMVGINPMCCSCGVEPGWVVAGFVLAYGGHLFWAKTWTYVANGR